MSKRSFPILNIVCSPGDESLLKEMLGAFEAVDAPADGFFLAFEEDVLKLKRVGDRQGVWVSAEEIERRLSGQFLLGRACGLGNPDLTVLDATGGLGVDALALHRRGAHLQIVEREPLLWALLKDLVRRLAVDSVKVLLADSVELLAAGAEYDVVYLDPMFPSRRKKALPNKRMQYLSALFGESESFDTRLLELARQQARSRVVLKRRKKDPEMDAPDWSLTGRSIRYDVYRCQ